jgi:hypothetical protein
LATPRFFNALSMAYHSPRVGGTGCPRNCPKKCHKSQLTLAPLSSPDGKGLKCLPVLVLPRDAYLCWPRTLIRREAGQTVRGIASTAPRHQRPIVSGCIRGSLNDATRSALRLLECLLVHRVPSVRSPLKPGVALSCLRRSAGGLPPSERTSPWHRRKTPGFLARTPSRPEVPDPATRSATGRARCSPLPRCR